jgi:predicted dehydrogenase
MWKLKIVNRPTIRHAGVILGLASGRHQGVSGMERIAIIGCGFFSPNHVWAWSQLPGAELVAVCDLNLQRAQDAGRLAGAPAFSDAAKMLDDLQPDVVDIVTTVDSHVALAELCADRHVAAIIQKPLAYSLSDAQHIARLAAKAGIRIMVHENFRFQRPVREVKALIIAGAIGEPRYASVGFRCGHNIFEAQPYLRTNERLVLADIGVHVFDVARFLMGEIADLSCRTQRVRADVRGEDMSSALLGFSSGAIGLVEASWSSFLPEDPFPEVLVAVEGTSGSIILDRHYRINLRSGTEVREFSAEPPCPPWGAPPWHVVQDSVVETCRHWLETRKTGSSPETTVDDNVKTLAAVEACYLSAAAGGTVIRIDEVMANSSGRA